MNTQRLNALAAKAMGWTLLQLPRPGYVSSLWDNNGQTTAVPGDWDPSKDTNNALELLEHVADGRHWFTGRELGMPIGEYFAWMEQIGTSKANSVALAMTFCALRASPLVSDEEIQEALDGEA